MICVHCQEPYTERAGRGLCRTCWDQPTIRAKYPPLARFGGKGASACWAAQKRIARGMQRISLDRSSLPPYENAEIDRIIAACASQGYEVAWHVVAYVIESVANWWDPVDYLRAATQDATAEETCAAFLSLAMVKVDGAEHSSTRARTLAVMA